MKKIKITAVLVLLFAIAFGIGVSAHEALESKKAEVTITATNGGRVYNGDNNWSALSGLEMDRGTEITLEATERNGKFVYWKDDISGKIISDNPTYKFTLINDVKITAYFIPDNYLASYGYVTFADINGRIFYSNYVNGNNVREPDTSWVENPGYNIVGWDSDQWEDISTGDVLLIKAAYEKKDVYYTLSVTGGTAEPALSEYGYDSNVVVTADMARVPQGKVFAGWKMNGELVSYDKSFSFRMGCDTEIEAVYAETESDKLPVVAIVDMDADIYSKGVSILSYRNLPDDYELIQSGILMVSGTSTDAITIDSPSAINVKAIETGTKEMYRYNKTIGTGVKLRAVPYVIYKYEDELYITYGTEKEITR